jgi:tRNA U54 and U55 pseudouridine synthase Pus10
MIEITVDNFPGLEKGTITSPAKDVAARIVARGMATYVEVESPKKRTRRTKAEIEAQQNKVD